MEIEARIRNYVAQNLLFSDNGFEYDNDDSFLQEGIVDSVGVLELVLFVEETFGLTVDDQEITPDNFDSVNKLANYIRSKMNGRQ
jgi:acyl carrier protein